MMDIRYPFAFKLFSTSRKPIVNQNQNVTQFIFGESSRLFRNLVLELIVLKHPLINHHAHIVNIGAIGFDIEDDGRGSHNVWPMLIMKKAAHGCLFDYLGSNATEPVPRPITWNDLMVYTVRSILNSNSPIIIEFCYNIRYAATTSRSRHPSSVRQVAVYLQYNENTRSTRWILIQPSESIESSITEFLRGPNSDYLSILGADALASYCVWFNRKKLEST
ncbi:hypothetical protein F5Y11DRAFT_120956 [Daldinia sp. FL1419]|nr:hypothetical protein F5Y11DRAFT_120956 [Daldinia sp. FL1419]